MRWLAGIMMVLNQVSSWVAPKTRQGFKSEADPRYCTFANSWSTPCREHSTYLYLCTVLLLRLVHETGETIYILQLMVALLYCSVAICGLYWSKPTFWKPSQSWRANLALGTRQLQI